jgi:RNA polymerase sigma-B factor
VTPLSSSTARRPGHDRALDQLSAARDRTRARLTVPRVTVPRRWVIPHSSRPSVDLALWTDHVAYADRQDQRLLHRLIDRYSGFATATARRHFRRREPLDDLVQVSHEGLLRALQRFDPSRGTPFLAFAAPTISGMLRRHIRDTGWALRVPRAVHELSKPRQDAVDLLCQDLGRAPTLAEVADFMGVPLGQLESVERARRARSTASIDTGEDSAFDPRFSLSASEAGIEGAENLMALRRGLAQLDSEDVRLLAWYFFEEQTQTEIAERLGVSQMQVSRLLARAVQCLRPFLSPDL